MNYEEFMQRYSSAPTGAQAKQNTPAPGSYEAFMQRYGVSVENNDNSQAPGGPLQVAKGGGGLSAAPAAQSAPATQPKKETNMLYALLGGPVQLDERAQQRMRQAIESTKPAAVPAAPANGMSEDELLPFREIGQRGAAARVAQLTKAPQTVKKEQAANAYQAALEAKAKQNTGGLLFDQDAQWELLRQQDPFRQGVSYTANQAVNTLKNVGSVLLGQGKDYVNAYEQEWKRQMAKQDTPLEEAGKAGEALARNLNAGVGQGFQGVAMSADLLLPDNLTPDGVQKGLDWVKNTGERATEYANEFNREQGYGEMGPQLLQAIGGMASDLALAFFTAGGSAAAKIPQMATAGTGVKETAKQIVQQAVENPQFWLSFARTWGMDYQEALDRGATESQALAAASLGSAVNAAIEVGGGVQTQFQEGAESGLRGVVKSALEEGGEEVGQNIVSNAVNGLVFDSSAPLVSLSDERAVLNPLREANSFAVGAMAGGLMSAPGNLMRAGNRPGAANAQQAVLQPDAKTAEAQAPAVGSEALNSKENLARFADEVDDTFLGKRSASKAIVIGHTPQVYQQLGAEGLDLTINPGTLYKIAYPDGYMHGKHNLGIPALKQLPAQLENPIAVLRSQSQADSFVVLTEWEDAHGNPVIVPVHLNKRGTVGFENVVPSAYGKENITNLLGRNGENILWTKENEDIAKLLSVRLRLPQAVADDTLVSRYSIPRAEGNVNAAPAVEMPAGADTYRRLAGLDDSPASRAQGAVTALDVELLQNLDKQEEIKAQMEALPRGSKQLPAAESLWTELSQLMDRQNEIRAQREVFQRQAENGGVYVPEDKKTGTAAPKVPEVSNQVATPTVPVSDSISAMNEDVNAAAPSVQNTVVNDDPAVHTPAEQQRIEEYKAAVDSRVAEFVQAVRAEPQNRWRKLELGQVDSQTAARIQQLTGVDVSGYTHTIQPSAVEHIDNGHGINGISDHSMQNVEDVARIPWVLKNYDTITREMMKNGKPFLSGEFKNKDGSRAQTVVFKKAIDGTIYVVEAVPDSKAKRLQLVTAYITENGQKSTGAYQEATVQGTISHTPEAELEFTPVTSSIPTQERQVNRGTNGQTLKNGQKNTGAYQVPDVETTPGQEVNGNGMESLARDPYDLASLYRSDPRRAGVDEAAQARAQQKLQDRTRQGSQKDTAKLQGTTGDPVKDAFAVHPITERVNFGLDAQSIRVAEQRAKQLENALERARVNHYRPGGDATTVEVADARQVAAGEKTMRQLSAGSRADVVAELAALQSELNDARQSGIAYQKRSIFEHQQTVLRGMLGGINDAAELMDKPVSIAQLNRRTPERVLRLVFGEQRGRALSDLLIKPIHANESAKVQFINEMFNQARALDLNQVECQLVQLVGERAQGKRGEKPITVADIRAGSITEEMLPGSMTRKEKQYLLNNLRSADPAKVEKAVGWYRQAYKSLWELVNDFRLEHGLPEIGWQENYFPHFNEDDPLTKTLKQLGIEGVSGLPTSIAGQTAWFKPNSRYVPFFQHREGIATTYDSNLGFQSYLTAVADMLYHTDDIMRLRNLDGVLRGKKKELDVGNIIDSILGKKNLQLNEQEAAMIDKVLKGEYMDAEAAKSYSTFAQWLTDYTNKLANKQIFGDRWFERRFGRAAFNVAGKIETAFARNSTVGNLSTALNNTITLPKVLATTPQKYVAQAVKGLATGEFKASGIAQQSEFLLGKKGVRPLVESGTQRMMRAISDKTFEPVETMVSDVAFYSKYLQTMAGNGGNQSAAIETANDYAAYMMARRTKGARPLNFEARDPFQKLFSLFQTEVSNDYYSLKDDLPAYIKQAVKGGNGDEMIRKVAAGTAKYLVYSTALNALLESITGYAPAPDPLRWIWEFIEALMKGDEEEEPAEAASRVGGAAWELTKNVLNQMPGASTTMALAGIGDGRVPLPEFNLKKVEQGALALLDSEEDSPNKYGYAAKNLWDGAIKPGMMTLMPFGGNQLRKTMEGIKVMGQGAMYSESKDGQKLQADVENDPLTLQGAGNWLKALAFGRSAIGEVRDYYDTGAKPKSVGYTEAYKAGYSTSILDALYPSSSQSAGKATYQQMTGGAPGAAKVDSWMEALMEYNGSKNMMPSNTTTSVTVDGETVKLTGPQALDFAQTKVQTSYSILDALRPQAGNYDRQVQARYAARAQDYAQAVAKEQVLGVEPNAGSWVEELQNYSGVKGKAVNDKLLNALLASSIVEETKPDYYPNGNPVSGSRKRKALASLRAAGFDTRTAMQMWEVFS